MHQSFVLSLLFLFLVSVLSGEARAKSHATWGKDDRKEIFEAPKKWKRLSRSVAAIMGSYDLEPGIKNGIPGFIPTQNENLIEQRNACSDERFAYQKSSAYCSGFLVASNILVTAGHCRPCEKGTKFVFGFSHDQNRKSVYNSKFFFPKNDVYTLQA